MSTLSIIECNNNYCYKIFFNWTKYFLTGKLLSEFQNFASYIARNSDRSFQAKNILYKYPTHNNNLICVVIVFNEIIDRENMLLHL